MTKTRPTGSAFKKKRMRKLIAYQEDDKHQVFREELDALATDAGTLRYIIGRIKDISMMIEVKYPTYDRFSHIVVDFGRLRLGDFRIFVHRIDTKNWLMLSIYRKTTDETPAGETKKAINRLSKYLKENKKS